MSLEMIPREIVLGRFLQCDRGIDVHGKMRIARHILNRCFASVSRSFAVRLHVP